MLPLDPDARRGLPGPELSCTLLRSVCVVALTLDNDDIAATWSLLRSSDRGSASIPLEQHVLRVGSLRIFQTRRVGYVAR
jgi:hypothetical protein